MSVEASSEAPWRRERIPRKRLKNSLQAALHEHLSEEVARLDRLGMEINAIARVLRINSGDVRALRGSARGRDRFSILSRRAMKALINGRHAQRGGRTLVSRVRNLEEIAIAYSDDDLLAEPGIGIVTASEIRYWLDARGLKMREVVPQQIHL